MSASLRFALFTIADMALCHSSEISYSSGGSGSCRTSLACVRVCVVLLGSVVICVSVFFGEHDIGCVSEPRNAFPLSCV